MANTRVKWKCTVTALTLAVVTAVGCLLVFGGPASNLYPAEPLQRLSSRHPGGKAFVRNPELSEELEILQASGVFEIVSAYFNRP